jgi:OOP family OmpA-OmpF porin
MTLIARRLLATSVFATASLLAAAAHADGFSVGANVGGSDYRGDSIGGLSTDRSGTAYKLFGGYTINPYFSVEGGYADLGHFNSDGGRLRARGIFADAVGTYPLGYNVSALGRLGVFTGRLSENNDAASLTAPNTYQSGSGTSLKLGGGLQYDLSKQVALRGEWEQYHFDAIDSKPKVNLFSVGVNYKF